MKVHESLMLAAVALAMLGASSGAQSHQSGKVFARYNKPLESVSLDLSTGTVTHRPAVHNKTATTTVDFNNNDLSGFVGVDSGNSFCEWFDSANKGFAGNRSDLMNDIVFAYCSAMLTPGSGGPGGSVKLGFYEGYTLRGGAPTTAVAVFTLTGLPGNSASSSFFGGFNCFFIKVTFANLVAFADGPIGYSWKFLDVGTTGTLAGTWPFLSCVTSCSGVTGQIDRQGMTDAIDEYCPPGTLRSTFMFGTTSGSFTSIAMDIREAIDCAASVVSYNNTIPPFNADTLTAVVRPIIGQEWVGEVTHAAGTATGSILVVRKLALAGNGLPGRPGWGRILIGGPWVLTKPGVTDAIPPFSSSQKNFKGLVPLNLAYVDFEWAAQAITFGSSATRLSNGVKGMVCTQ